MIQKADDFMLSLGSIISFPAGTNRADARMQRTEKLHSQVYARNNRQDDAPPETYGVLSGMHLLMPYYIRQTRAKPDGCRTARIDDHEPSCKQSGYQCLWVCKFAIHWGRPACYTN